MEKIKHRKEKDSSRSDIESDIPSAPTMEDFNYDPDIILDNTQLNMAIILSIYLGSLSLALSFWPNIFDILGKV